MAELTFTEKLELYKQEFAARGVREDQATPRVFRLLWAWGFQMPPPVFCGVKKLSFIYGLLGGLGFSVLSLIINYIFIPMLNRFSHLDIYDLANLKILVDFVLCFFIGGVPLGLFVAYEYHRMARKYHLPSWAEYGHAEHHISSLNNSADAIVKSLAAEALGKIGDECATVPLLNAMNDSRHRIRVAAIEALGRIGDERATASLVKALKDRNETIRAKAAWGLGQMKNENAVGPLIAAMSDSGTIGAAVAEALGKIGDKRAVPTLLNALKDRDEYLRSSAAEALGLLEDEAALDALIAALKDENEFVRGTAAKALGQMGDKSVIAPLLYASADSHEYVRGSVAEALGMLEDPRFVDNLIVALKDVNDYVRCAAAQALGNIGDERAVDPLIDVAKDRGGNWDADKAAVRSLRKIIESYQPFLRYYPDLFCSACLRRARLKNILPVRSVEQSMLVFCPKCHRAANFLTGVKTVVGVIGGKTETLGRIGDLVEVPLWNETGRKARFADIDILYIRKGGVDTYHLAINAVIIALSTGLQDNGTSLKKIQVEIEAGTGLAAGTVGMLKDNFKLA